MRPGQFPPAPPLGVGVDRFAEAAGRVAEGRADLRRRAGSGLPAAPLRRFSAAELCRWRLPLDLPALREALRADPSLPQGQAETPGAPPSFDFAEAQALEARFARETRPRRPEGAAPKVVAVANFKGGVGKTTLAANLAMSAALDGLRVLAVDLDSQGSLSAIFGVEAADEWETAYPLLARDYAAALAASGAPVEDEALARALALPPAALLRPTRWPTVDLVPAQLDLYWAEFQIPVWRLGLKAWRLWDALGRGLAEVSGGYDLVVVDTPPALGYLTVNALAVADVLLVPLGASFLEFDSTGRFFDMLHATFASIEAAEGGAERFEWDAVRCVLTRYDAAQQAELAELVGRWFGDLMAETRLEATALVGQAGEQARAILEADPRDFNPATYRRGRAGFEALWAEVRGLVEAAWARDLEEAGQETGQGGFARETLPAPGRTG